MTYTAEDLDLSVFDHNLVSYGARGVTAPALKVTNENIGQLAIELHLDVLYLGGTTPTLQLWAARYPEDSIELDVRPGNWIVFLWHEIHVFRDDVFLNTFDIVEVVGKEELPQRTLADVLGQEEAEKLKNTDWAKTNPAEDLRDALERPPWIPNDAERYIEKATGNEVWFRPGAYESLDDSAKALFQRQADKVEVVPSVGEQLEKDLQAGIIPNPLDLEEAQASGRLYRDALAAAKGPEGTQVMEPVEAPKPASETSMAEREQIVQGMKLEGYLDETQD